MTRTNPFTVATLLTLFTGPFVARAADAQQPCKPPVTIGDVRYRVEAGWLVKSACAKPIDARITALVVSQPAECPNSGRDAYATGEEKTESCRRHPAEA